MNKILIDPTAAEKIKAAKPRLRPRSWGGTETVCMMSAMVSGAKSVDDCVTKGWPMWLVALNMELFDSCVGGKDSKDERYEFALGVAKAVQEERDYDRARNLYLISRLETGEYSAMKSIACLDGNRSEQHLAIERVVTLLSRQLAEESIGPDLFSAAAAAANIAAHAVRNPEEHPLRRAACLAAEFAAAHLTELEAPASATAFVSRAAREASKFHKSEELTEGEAHSAAYRAARNDLIESILAS